MEKLNIADSLLEIEKQQCKALSTIIFNEKVSGSRFWSFIEETFKTPENFFQNCYVHNYCPISMMTSTAKNITPPELKANERKILFDICDESLVEVIKLLEVKCLVGIGKFAEARANSVFKAHEIAHISVTGIMHPSPINPAANKGWKDIAGLQLKTSGVLNYLIN